ncbi:TPA: hypothetical protein OTY97_000204 [Citrobacter koseri]|nr:hypothetical protein [Citrobacter koseri]
MGIPGNYYLKGYIDDSRPGHIETLFQATFSGTEEVVASCPLLPEEVFLLVERLYWTSIDGDTIYKNDDSGTKLILKYPFSRFWDVITNNFAIAQYSEHYGLSFQLNLREKLNLDNLQFPHFIRITLPGNSIGDEFNKIKTRPHHAGIDHFECRSDIISHATYVEGMLYKIIINSGLSVTGSIDEMTFNEKTVFCRKNKLLKMKLINIVWLLKNLRNEAAHQFSFEIDDSSESHLEIKPVSEKLLVGIKEFVKTCEKRYGLTAAKIHRFDNSFRMLAGELNEAANLTQVITLGKQFPVELSSYFYG